MTRADLLADAVRRLAAAGVEEPARDARHLLRAAVGLEPAALSAALGAVPDAEEAARFAGLVARRLRREPVAQILGRRTFWGREFEVTADVLDPRPETETLIAAALALGPKARVLDLGTGTGCLLLTLLAEWPRARGLGVEASAPARAVALRNAVRLGLSDRAEIVAGDWLAGVAGPFDLVVANPPYIPEAEVAALAPEVAAWEPRAALTPGGDGLGAFRAIAAGVAVVLAPGGALLVEFGMGQGAAVEAIFAAAGLRGGRLLPDLSGRPRALLWQG